MNRLVVGAVIAAVSSVTGCANLNSIYREFDVSKGKSPMVDIRQRAVVVSTREVVTETRDANDKITGKTVHREGPIVCAEPSPDAMAALAYEVAAKGGKASTELAVAMQDSATFVGLRTQSIQMLRDYGYRLCESYLSGSISKIQYDMLMRRYQKNTVALLAIEQLTGTVKVPPIALTTEGKAEATKSLAEQRKYREELAGQIADLEKQKAEKLEADDKADTKELDGKITRLKEDLAAIDDAIKNTKGVLVSGASKVEIKVDGAPSQRSDEHIQKIAEVVGKIVGDIVLSDDSIQMCLSLLQTPVTLGDAADADFRKWCVGHLNSYTNAINLKIEAAQTTNALILEQLRTGSPAEKKAAQEEMEKLQTDVEKINKGFQFYDFKPGM